MAVAFPVDVSQILAMTPAPVRKNLPSALNSILRIVFACSTGEATGRLDSASQIHTLLDDAVSTTLPLGLNCADSSLASCRSGEPIRLPVPTSQRPAVPSLEAVSSCC